MKFKCLLILPLLVASLQAASVSDLTFTLINGDTEYSVSGCDDYASGPLDIPSSYNDLPVTSIGDYAFQDCSNLSTIIIHDSVISIGIAAFNNCTGLNSITIPDSVTSIGDGAFYDCSNIVSITIPNGVTSIGYQTFGSCIGLTSITIPDSVTSIGTGAFISCTSLASITIPDGVTSIGYEAFGACVSLTSITIPDSVTSIGNYAFVICSALTNITFEGDAPASYESTFQDIPSDAIIYYYDDATGFSTLTYSYDSTQLVSNTNGSFHEQEPYPYGTEIEDFSVILQNTNSFSFRIEGLQYGSGTFGELNTKLQNNEVVFFFNVNGQEYSTLDQSNLIIGISSNGTDTATYNLDENGLSLTFVLNSIFEIYGDFGFFHTAYYAEEDTTTLLITSGGNYNEFAIDDTNPLIDFTLFYPAVSPPTWQGVQTQMLSRDSDGDGLNDGVETNTGTFVSATDTGTDPNNVDTDGDGFSDGIETNTGVFVSLTNTGTDPNNADSLHTPTEMATARSESRTLGQTDVTGNPSQYGLFTSSDLNNAQSNSRTAGQQDVIGSPSDYDLMGAEGVFDMRVSQPGISMSGDKASMNFTIQSSSDLQEWNNEETIQREYTMPSDKNFMRVSVGPEIEEEPEPEPEPLTPISTDIYGDKLVYDESNNLYVNDENTPLMKDGVNVTTDTFPSWSFYAIEPSNGRYYCILKRGNQNLLIVFGLDGNFLSGSTVTNLGGYQSMFGQRL
jgi:hypothetical protein